MSMRFDIDLTFAVDQPTDRPRFSRRSSGTIKAAGKTIHLKVDSYSLFPSIKQLDRRALNDFATKLKKAGVKIVVDGPEGTLLTLGDVKPNFSGRIASRSGAVRLGSLPDASKLFRGRGKRTGAESFKIPATPFPLLPTFRKNYRLRATTTHYADGGGRPRLIFVQDSESWDGKAPKVLNIMGDSIEIGSAPENGLTLPGLEPVHARITRNDLDEFVVEAVGRVGGSAGLKPGDRYTLRSGARMELNGWRLVFYREEYADHGRPFGGRNGGELAVQRPQYNPRTGNIERDSSV